MTHYPRDTKLAKIVLSIDWYAYEGNTEVPLMEWTIDSPTSEYYPGTHCDVIHLKTITGGTNHCEARVEWKSPIYSPLVRDRGRREGNLIGEEALEDGLIDITDLFQSIAHVRCFGPFPPATEAESPPFTFLPTEPLIWTHYDKQDATAQKAFKQAASFFSRAYNQDLPDDAEPTSQEDFRHAIHASIVAITGLLDLYQPEWLDYEDILDWDVERPLEDEDEERLEERGEKLGRHHDQGVPPRVLEVCTKGADQVTEKIIKLAE